MTPSPADLRELREDLRARGGPAAALADALPDRLGAMALDAITPGVVRALRVSIYGDATMTEAGRDEESKIGQRQRERARTVGDESNNAAATR